MSVINRVLNDIEQRKQQAEAAQGYEVVDIKEPPSNTKWIVALVLCCVVLAGLGYALTLDSKSDEAQQAPIAQEVVVVEPPVVTPAERTNVVVVDAEPSGSSQELAREQVTQQNVEIVAAKKTVNQDVIAGNTTVEPTQVADAVKQQQVTQSDVAVETKIVKPVKSAVEQKAPVITSKKPKKKLSITPVEVSPQEVANLKFQQGLKAQKVGKIELAQKRWLEALKLEPTLHDARIQLAASYYGENNSPDALKILDEGNSKYPNFDGYRLLAAQIYYQANEFSRALAVLDNPYLDGAASEENLTLAASIAQQLKRWPMAMNNYQQLVNRQGNNPQWLLGLAISQDAQKLSQQALKHYRQLLTLTSDQAVYDYATGRIAVLQQELVERGQNG
ncbi:MAG: tetratricopeptide repeat protein [Psychrobium sp.]